MIGERARPEPQFMTIDGLRIRYLTASEAKGRRALVAFESGHIAWEDKADEYGASIKYWVEGGFRNVC